MSDFTFKDVLTGILKFNDENVMHIGFDTDSEDIIITNWNAAAGTSKTLQTNMNSSGSGYSNDDIASHAFTGDVVLESATTIHGSAFEDSFITSASGLTPTKIKGSAFRDCPDLVSVEFPNVTDMSAANNVFSGCSELKSVKLPKLSNISSSTNIASSCPKLEVFDAGVIGSMTNNFFNGDSALRTLILRKTGSICTTNWASSAVFGGIYDNPAESKIYVPEDLISTYQAATNWSALYTLGVTFAKIEGSIYE